MNIINKNKEALAEEIGVDALEPLARDVSPREYFRGIKNDRNFILMVYPDASEDHRVEMLNFISIGAWLEKCLVKTPALYHVDKEKCIAKFEDLGKISFGKALRANPDKQLELYSLAVDVLKLLGGCGVPDNLPDYIDSHIHKNRRQIIDYYIPLLRNKACSSKLLNDYLAVWAEIEQQQSLCPKGFVHGDFHLENLIYMDSESGLRQCALIDYQDALYGGLPYDLVNLLEDARIDIPHDLRTAMIDRYCASMSAESKQVFLKWYRILGTQFHCRVLGLFIKLSAEQGRDDYLIHIARLQNYIREALNDPLLLPLKLWFEKEGVDFTPIKDLHGERIRNLFQDISF